MKIPRLVLLFAFVAFEAQAASPLEDFIKGLFSRPNQYVALGKIMAAPPVDGAAGYYVTQLTALKSPELLAAARVRVAREHPDTPATNVEIRVMRSEGSMILRVAAIGEEQKFTRMAVTALMDEFMDRQSAAQLKGPQDSLKRLMGELSLAEKECMDIQDKLAATSSPADIAKLRQDFEKAKAHYEEVKGRLEKHDIARELDRQMSIIERPFMAIRTR